jgi:archaellum component FlaG (FlaF/FlaG flagellin family)
MNEKRKGISPIPATAILLGIALTSSIILGVFYKEVTSAYTNYSTLEFISATSYITKSVENAKWGIVFVVKNSGTENILIEDLAVNNELINAYGILSGDSLSDKYSTSTSISENGYNISPGESISAYIWIGSGLYSSGTSINIQILNVNSVDLSYNVYLA